MRPFISFCHCAVESKRGRIRRVKSALILALLCCAPWCAKSQASGPQRLYAPAPEYPLGARVHYWTGNGIFVCKISPDGTVSAVNVKQSTGHEILDQAAIAALRRWRFKAGGGNFVSVPIKLLDAESHPSQNGWRSNRRLARSCEILGNHSRQAQQSRLEFRLGFSRRFRRPNALDR